MVETTNTEIRRQLINVAVSRFLLTSLDVLAGGVLSAFGLIIGSPIMGATGLLLGLPSVRQGAKDLHDGLEAIKKLSGR